MTSQHQQAAHATMPQLSIPQQHQMAIPQQAQLQMPQQQAPMGMPQQQIGMPQQQMGMPQQQMGFVQQPMALPQQPIYLAQAAGPGGGFYYVTTAANGQPIVLQPVGVLPQTPGGQNGLPYVDTSQQMPMTQPMQPTTPHQMQSGGYNDGFSTHRSDAQNGNRASRQSRDRPYRGGTSM